jgi:coenzyme F420-reducing hydrogenase gamma subunit
VTAKPRVAVFKLTSCDGCQLQLLDAEEALLAIADAVDVVYFREATSHEDEGPYDVTLVEGSISTPDQLEEIREIRRRSRFLIAIGACATAGGIQALRNTVPEGEPARRVYPSPEVIRALPTSTALSEHVRVDLELPGCPIDRGQLLGALASLLAGAVPRLSTAPVCQECKRRGFVCVMVARGEPCLGPVTRTGCGALCPGVGRGCFGCFGPIGAPNTSSLGREFVDEGRTPEEVGRRFHLITGWAPGFRDAAEPEHVEASA